MGKRFLHTVVLPAVDVVTSVNVTPFDLPVNPLSFLLLRFQVTNLDPAVMDVYDALDELMGQITGVRVLHKGEQIISGSLRDLHVLNAVYHRAYPGWSHISPINDAVRSVVFPLCLGKRMYDPVSCFPATVRGNLRMEIDVGAEPASYDDINVSVEAVELIEATPTEHVKYVRQARDSVLGQFDAPLPIGNPLLGILMFDTGLSGSTDEVLSWGTVKLLKDNVEQYYPLSDYETLAGMLNGQMGSSFGMHAGHVHGFIAPGPAADVSDKAGMLVSTGAQGYAYLDFDPLRDGMYELETAGAADLKIRGQGDEATAIRYYPIERVMVVK
jgi:hypothetical protein